MHMYKRSIPLWFPTFSLLIPNILFALLPLDMQLTLILLELHNLFLQHLAQIPPL